MFHFSLYTSLLLFPDVYCCLQNLESLNVVMPEQLPLLYCHVDAWTWVHHTCDYFKKKSIDTKNVYAGKTANWTDKIVVEDDLFPSSNILLVLSSMACLLDSLLELLVLSSLWPTCRCIIFYMPNMEYFFPCLLMFNARHAHNPTNYIQSSYIIFIDCQREYT